MNKGVLLYRGSIPILLLSKGLTERNGIEYKQDGGHGKNKVLQESPAGGENGGKDAGNGSDQEHHEYQYFQTGEPGRRISLEEREQDEPDTERP